MRRQAFAICTTAVLGAPAFAAGGWSPPPSKMDALRAIEARWLENAEGGWSLSEFEVRALPGFPSDISVDRCDHVDARQIGSGLFEPIYAPGHECIVTVYPNRAPAFQTFAFFFHDGFDWRASAKLVEPFMVEGMHYEDAFIDGEITPKDGGVAYDGLAGKGDAINPYDALLDR